MKKKKLNCVIVGGGPVGILASILLADIYKNVTVIENNSILGGLLSCFQDDKGNYYDIGTHVPNITNIKELDDILFGAEKEREKNWIEFGKLSTQNYFNGIWNRSNSMVDVRSLGKEKYDRGVVEFFHANEKYSPQDSFAKIMTETYGQTFTQEIFIPIVQKLFGVTADKLEKQSCLKFFGLSRLVMLTTEVTNRLKQIEFFDKKIAYHKNIGSELLHYYPKSPKCCGYWIDSLVIKAKEKSVVFKTETIVKKVYVENKNIYSIETSETQNIDCDLLVWTIPPVLALKAADISYTSHRPILRTTSIFHYCLDKELLIKDALYVWCMDPNFKSFRITLYPNLNPEKQKTGYTVTSEILSNPEESNAFNSEMVLMELISLGIVDKDSKVLSQAKQILHNTFPVPEIGFLENVNQISNKAQNEMSNLLLFGRSTGKTWFMTDVFRDVFEKIQDLK